MHSSVVLSWPTDFELLIEANSKYEGQNCHIIETAIIYWNGRTNEITAQEFEIGMGTQWKRSVLWKTGTTSCVVERQTTLERCRVENSLKEARGPQVQTGLRATRNPFSNKLPFAVSVCATDSWSRNSIALCSLWRARCTQPVSCAVPLNEFRLPPPRRRRRPKLDYTLHAAGTRRPTYARGLPLCARPAHAYNAPLRSISFPTQYPTTQAAVPAKTLAVACQPSK